MESGFYNNHFDFDFLNVIVYVVAISRFVFLVIADKRMLRIWPPRYPSGYFSSVTRLLSRGMSVSQGLDNTQTLQWPYLYIFKSIRNIANGHERRLR